MASVLAAALETEDEYLEVIANLEAAIAALRRMRRVGVRGRVEVPFNDRVAPRVVLLHSHDTTNPNFTITGG